LRMFLSNLKTEIAFDWNLKSTNSINTGTVMFNNDCKMLLIILIM